MFTKEIFKDYFEQIIEIEKNMAELYTNLYNQVKHPEYKGIFSRLAIEERQHESLINNIMDSFGK